MSRKHLFVLVVLLGAAVVAGLLALTRTTALGTAATPSSAQIAAKSRSLDRLEASLRRSLAEGGSTAESRQRAATAPRRTVYVQAPQPAAVGYEHEDDDHEYEDRGEDD